MSKVQANTVVYVVTGAPRESTNDRVRKVLELREYLAGMVLVVRGAGRSTADTLEVRPIPSPISWLAALKLYRLRNTLRRFLFFPSTHVLFTAVAKRRLLSRVRADLARGRRVCLLTCVPNHENTSLGLYLKRRVPELRWVVDWQDLWSYDENYFEQVPPAYRGRLRRRERQVLDTADVNVTTNERARDVLHDVYGVPGERLVALPHPFDSDARVTGGVPGMPTAERSLKIGFLGALFKPPRVPGLELVETLRELRAAGRPLELHLHGPLPPEMERLRPWLEESGVVFGRTLRHEECAAAMADYDMVLLLLADLPNARAVMSIKLPQYLLTGRPIIAVVPRPSAVSDIVEATATGIVLPTNEDWRRQLTDLLGAPERMPRLDRNVAAIRAFAWNAIAPAWMDVLCGTREGRTAAPAEG